MEGCHHGLPNRHAHRLGTWLAAMALGVAPVLMTAQTQARIWHAQAQQAGSGTGVGWANATTLQGAMEQAKSGDQIWAKAGTYIPTSFNGHDESHHGNDLRHRHFAPRDGVEVYGGFAGHETSLDQRDWRANPTILDGRVGPDARVYHVLVNWHTKPGPNTILDGLVITGGNACGPAGYDGYGGGMINLGADVGPTVRNCVFQDNHAIKGGGAFFADLGADASFVNCIFRDNTTAGLGGAIGLLDHCQARIGGCLFHGNTGGFGGAILADSPHCALAIRNCTFADNASRDAAGGALAVLGPRVTIANSIVWGNRPDSIHDRDQTIMATHCNIQEGMPIVVNLTDDPRFVDPKNGNYRLQPQSPCVDAGDNERVPEDLPRDLDGNPRMADGGTGAAVVDLGAIELMPEPGKPRKN
jgi:hypothetical protein